MAANPLPSELDLPDDVAGSRPPLDLLTNEGRVALTGVLHGDPATAPRARKRPWWAKPATVFATACLLVFGAIGIVVVSSGGQTDFVDDSAPTTTAPLPAGSAAYDVRAVAVAPDGSLWAATYGGLVRWDVATGTPTVYSTEDGLPTDDVWVVAVGSDGTVWTGGSGWMARFDGSWTTFSAPLSEGPMVVGPDGAVWSAFGERDLARFDGSGWQTFEVPLSLDQRVTVPWTGFLDVAADGTVWAGTHELQGVFSFDGANWTHFTTVDGLPAPLSGTVAAAPDGTVWVGSMSVDGSPGAGAARFDGSTWTVYTTADGLLDDVPDVVVGADGTVWAIHHNGVSRFDGDTWTAFPGVTGIGMFAAVDGAGTLWMPARDGGVIGFDGVDTTRLEMPARETPSPPTTVTARAGTWNPILATTRAKAAPPAATCPPGTDPNAPGPADQERPEARWTSLLGAAFDQHTGRIVYVDTLGETWTFDVCTNTWHRMNPTGAMIGELTAGMVYDVDSDRTVALGETVNVYDANTNTWTQPSNDTIGFGDGRIIPMGAVYDPISGLIITTDLTDSYPDTWAYDVDTNTWTLIGRLWEQQGQDYTRFELLGYSQETDRLILTSVDNTTALVDPRTGEATLITTATPGIDFGWTSAQYGPAADTVYVAEGVWVNGGMFNTRFPDQICGFDPGTSAWTSCFAIPPNNSRYAAFGAVVGDPINHRIVLIHGVYGSFWVNADGNVWAIDLDTGDWTQLLEPSNQ